MEKTARNILSSNLFDVASIFDPPASRSFNNFSYECNGSLHFAIYRYVVGYDTDLEYC